MGDHGGGAIGLAQRQHLFAQPMVGGALQVLAWLVAAGPGFNAGVQIQHVVPLAPGDQVTAAHLYGQIQQHIARAQMRGQQLGVVAFGEGLLLQCDAHVLRHSRALQISRPGGDARRLNPQSLDQQWHQALAYGAKADEKEAGGLGFQGGEDGLCSQEAGGLSLARRMMDMGEVLDLIGRLYFKK